MQAQGVTQRQQRQHSCWRLRGGDRLLAIGPVADGAALRGEVDAITEVIGYLRRIRNEQDPVRARVLTALAGVGRARRWPTLGGGRRGRRSSCR